MKSEKTAILYAILAAFCYSINTPVSKLLLADISPAFMASLLYLGAGLGMSAVMMFRRKEARNAEARLTRKQLPYVAAMIVLDIAAPISLMTGLSMTSPATASLLNNFEIVVTTVIALVVFKEAVGKRLWLAIALITLSSIILTGVGFAALSFSPGSLLVILACVCWGIENNCTRMLSLKDPLQIVIIKGFGSGIGSLIVALLIGDISATMIYIAITLLLGFVAYGLSIYFYIRAQRVLGASRTSAFYAFAPFIGVALSIAMFRETPTISFWASFVLMLAGAYLAAFENHEHEHTHMVIAHEHRHNHKDGHHNHTHEQPVAVEHSHVHIHAEQKHKHRHTPDLHHVHSH